MTCHISEHQCKHCAATVHTHAALLPHTIRYGISFKEYPLRTLMAFSLRTRCILSTNVNVKVEKSSTTCARTRGTVPFSKGDFRSLTLIIEIWAWWIHERKPKPYQSLILPLDSWAVYQPRDVGRVCCWSSGCRSGTTPNALKCSGWNRACCQIDLFAELALAERGLQVEKDVWFPGQFPSHTSYYFS